MLSISKLQAQPKDLNDNIKLIMDNIRNKKYEAVTTDELFKESNAIEAITILKTYSTDSLSGIRSKAHDLIALVGRKSGEKAVRTEAVNTLLQSYNDKDAGNSGSISESLKLFRPEDFDNSARTQLNNLLTPTTAYLHNLAQLAGYIGATEYQSSLMNLLSANKISGKNKWSIQLALARLGNEEMLNQLMARIAKVPVNDDFIYEAGPALVYMRQKKSLDFLFEIIMSDNKNCESANPDSNEKILCAYRALEIVAPVVENFPLKVDVGGDLITKDYTKALATAREWYKVHQKEYQLLKDTF